MEVDVKTEVHKEVGRSKSQNVVLEIIETEKSFIQDMGQVIAGYGEFFDKFKKDHAFQMLSTAIERLINFSKVLLADLEKKQQNLEDFSGIFAKKSMEFYEFYGVYCDVYPLTCAMLENMDPKSHYGTILNNCKTKIGHALPLSSYLLKPIQRVMKYYLLLSTIESDKSLDEEIKKIVHVSTEKMKTVADSINEGKRIQEGYAQLPILRSKIINLKKPLNYELVGPLVLQDHFKINNKKRFVILFENVILFSKIVDVDYYSVLDGISINKILLLETVNKDEASFELKESSKSKSVFILSPKSKSTKDLWVMHIKRLILKNLNVKFDESKLAALFGENVGAKINTLITAQNLINIEDLIEKNKNSDINQGSLDNNSETADPELSSTKKSTLSSALDNIDMIRRNQRIFDLEALLYIAPSRLSSTASALIDMNTDSNNRSSYSTMSSETGNNSINSTQRIKYIDLRSKSVCAPHKLQRAGGLIDSKNGNQIEKDKSLHYGIYEFKNNKNTTNQDSLLTRKDGKDFNKSSERINKLNQEYKMPLRKIENINNNRSVNFLNKEKSASTLLNLPLGKDKTCNDKPRSMAHGLANFFEMNDKNAKEVRPQNNKEIGSKNTLVHHQTSLSSSNNSASMSSNPVSNARKIFDSNNTSIKLPKTDHNVPVEQISSTKLPSSKPSKSAISSFESPQRINIISTINSPENLNNPISKGSRIGSILMKLQENYSQSQARFDSNPKTIICIGKQGIPVDKLPGKSNSIDQNANDTNDQTQF